MTGARLRGGDSIKGWRVAAQMAASLTSLQVTGADLIMLSAPSYTLPEFLHHEVLVVTDVAYANDARIGTVYFKPVALVGLDRSRCGWHPVATDPGCVSRFCTTKTQTRRQARWRRQITRRLAR